MSIYIHCILTTYNLFGSESIVDQLFWQQIVQRRRTGLCESACDEARKLQQLRHGIRPCLDRMMSINYFMDSVFSCDYIAEYDKNVIKRQ